MRNEQRNGTAVYASVVMRVVGFCTDAVVRSRAGLCHRAVGRRVPGGGCVLGGQAEVRALHGIVHGGEPRRLHVAGEMDYHGPACA